MPLTPTQEHARRDLAERHAAVVRLSAFALVCPVCLAETHTWRAPCPVRRIKRGDLLERLERELQWYEEAMK